MVDVLSPRSQGDNKRFEIIGNADSEFEIRPESPPVSTDDIIAQNVSVPRKSKRSFIEKKAVSRSPGRLSFCPKNATTIADIPVDALRMTWEQFKAVQAHRNHELTQMIPNKEDVASNIYVCNNETLRDHTSKDYIVIKEMDKLKLEIGELDECRTDLRVHAHLLRNDLAVILLLGWYEDSDRFCFLYEYAQNGDLLDELNKLNNPFDPDWFYRAKSEMKFIAQTLQFMHHEGWSHKDLTLENILVDEHHNFLLHDFALVEEFAPPSECESETSSHFVQSAMKSFHGQKSMQPNMSLISTQSATPSTFARGDSCLWSGKVEHMSPENYETFKGKKQMFDAFSNDVWGFCIILYACFSTKAFLWDAPDQRRGSVFSKVIKTLDSRLRDALKVDEQENEEIKTDLLLLVDLLQRVFVNQSARIHIDQLLEHPFFSTERNVEEKRASLIKVQSVAKVEPKLAESKPRCLEYCTLL